MCRHCRQVYKMLSYSSVSSFVIFFNLKFFIFGWRLFGGSVGSLFLYHVCSQAEGSEVSAELEFLNQQNLILSMENKALKQRLESLAQEKLIKHCESLSLSLSLSFCVSFGH